MVVTFTPQLEAILSEQARQRGVAPEVLALDALHERFLPASAPLEPRDEWERRLLGMAKDCGGSLSDAALSREEMYEKWPICSTQTFPCGSRTPPTRAMRLLPVPCLSCTGAARCCTSRPKSSSSSA